MMFKEIKTAVIGVGSMGKNHARVLNEISNLVAVVDLNEEQGRKVAEVNNTAFFNDYREIVDKVDAVCICVPTHYHKEVALFFSNSNKHILVEKPLSDNLIDAVSIKESAVKNNVVLSVGHIERFNPVIREAKKHILSKDWGKIITLNSTRVSNYPSRISDVGVLFDLSVHDIDIAVYLANSPVISVYVAGGSLKSEREEFVNIIFSHESGVISAFQTNWLTPMKVRSLDITTDKCFVKMNYNEQKINVFSSKYDSIDANNLFKSELKISKETIEVRKKEPLLAELEDFLSAIKNSHEPLVGGRDGVNVVKLAEASLESLKVKKAIYIQ